MSFIPRLSGALRVYSGLPGDTDTLQNTDDLVKKSRFVTKKKTAVEGSSWSKQVEKIKASSSLAEKDLSTIFRDLLHCAKQIAGETADTEVVEGAAVYLVEVFKSVDKVGSKETTSLKSVFGPFPASVATNACSIVNRITNSLPDDVIVLLGNNVREEADGAATVSEFGQGIKFVFPSCDTRDDDISSSDSDDEVRKEINLQYTAAVKSDFDKAKHTPVVKSSEGHIDSTWLQQEVTKAYGTSGSSELGLSVEDLSNTIFDFLSGPKSDSELQNDLFELLGFERFELIQTLLENRLQLLDAATREPEQARPNMPRPKLEGSSKPAYGCQVLIQTEQEKALLKQIRKDEKRYEKRGGNGAEDGEDNGFIPAHLRAQREAALQSAVQAPKLRSANTGRERYPNVYDKMEEARLSSAFVGGVKMHLPDTLTRDNNKIYEEVNIPPSDSAPTHVGENRVRIEQLDEIGRIAFKGTKTLNRIQTVVFETAYKTNENLLICAPTGAGKTNIAMLTILHEIKQHIAQGVIKKDEFKIIYVAPMKALAAEMVRNFGSRLEPLGISVRELTGDMSLTKSEILKTQMMVTTPEKWDVVTRKSTGDVALAQLVKLLIIDEVHLLHDDRGAVIESLVARTLRQVETSQSMIRIVGLSATLPNYLDVARFLHVNPYLGLFFFDGRFRPVPLGMSFIGVKSLNRVQQMQDFNTVCYEKVLYQVKRGYQVMVFVHARNETVRTASVLRDHGKNNGDSQLFLPDQCPSLGDAQKSMMKSRNKQMKELFMDGFSIHHAGMLRQDRNLVEKYFAAGHIKVLVCTATLAWGVNLPAHAVVIKGTQIYDAKKGSFVDLGILDVMQIFGRAGRPQYDTFGHGTIITTHEKLSHYLSLMTRQNPIESQFINSLTDNLNAEISLGTVTNVEEAVRWLSYSYLYVRLTINPLVYGVPYKSVESDPTLTEYRAELITDAGRKLDKARMVRFDERTGYFSATDQGRIASHFYIKYDTVEVINEFLKSVMTEADIFALISKSQEFDQIKVRDEEMDELERLLHEECEMQVPGGVENSYGKVNILLQSYVSRQYLDSFSLVSDQSYVAQNAARIMRSLFEVCLKKGWPIMASRLLNLSKTLDKRIWGFETPLRQFSILTPEIITKLEARKLSVDKLRDMDAKEIGHMLHHVKMGSVVKKCVHQLPILDLDASIQPITRTVLRVRLTITPMFKWDDKVHGSAAESFWIWVEDPDNNHIYHSEYFLLHKKQMFTGEAQTLVFTIPIFEPLPTQYYVKAISDRWLGCESMCAISFQHLILPERHPPHTELLDLQPLPVTALMNPMLETLYKFSHFNPIQTQLFHVLYHSDHNVLLGAPTGSGKTIAAELAIFRLFRERPNDKAVYIAPLKALVRERIEDWKVRVEQKLGKRVVELTGDVTPDMRAIAKADLIVTTPEKWDGVSRSWQTRNYVKAVSLIVIDEIHLLGNDRGPVLEVIVSRTNFISSHTERKVRVVGLSTALANARDLADWLGITQVGLYNFRPSVRPVPLEVHIAGFPGQHYCPRMATMNKPTFQAIKTHSPEKPTLVFVSSRRQTRLTALDLIAFLAGEDNPKQWLHMPEMEEQVLMMKVIKRLNFRFYMVLLGASYFFMLYVFHGNLQLEMNNCSQTGCSRNLQTSRFKHNNVNPIKDDSENLGSLDTKRKMLETQHEFFTPRSRLLYLDSEGTASSNIHGVAKHVEPRSENATRTRVLRKERCFLPANISNRTFQNLEPSSFIYSAYYDERYDKQFIRIMSVLSLNKVNRKLKVFCHFQYNISTLTQVATFYELCENHGKIFGGFILSCEVPDVVSNICSISVSIQVQPMHSKYVPPDTQTQVIQVTRLLPATQSYIAVPHRNNTVSIDSLKFNFSICIPPLFGKVETTKLIEFIELNKILGFQHFIFYISVVDNPDIIKVLSYYRKKHIVTIVDFVLPSVIQKSKIWYNGQLSAHNDCMYRAMSISNFVAIMDIDEYIVPHNGKYLLTDTLFDLFHSSNNVCGLSFDSAFYDSKFSKPASSEKTTTGLITQSVTGRSALYSKVRTKVIVRPEMIFEVGIHHISKPAQERYKVLKVNTSMAYLHHYRSCVPNYGMKCVSFEQDSTMIQYSEELSNNVKYTLKEVLQRGFEL